MQQKTDSTVLDGALFEKLMLGGISGLKAHAQEINDLNVFPIPDGDTGENMYLTVSGGINALKTSGNALGEKAVAFSKATLMSARGNSGVILSQFFAGIAQGFEKLETATVAEVKEAFKKGVEKGYGAVAVPVEGTILTVARESCEFASQKTADNGTIEAFLQNYIEESKRSLERTPELLPVLKEAGVIDSGGAGLIAIAEGALSALYGEENEISGDTVEFSPKKELDFSLFTSDSVMTFGYCTELLLRLQSSKTDVVNFSTDTLTDYLSTVGDSIVVFKTDSIVKIHVHTLYPWKIFEYCQRYGEFLLVKVENMTLQHNGTVASGGSPYVKRTVPKKKFGLVTVATGDKLSQLFKDLGADVVIDGGQGKNPSIERFIEAFGEVGAQNIYVLPNNKNITLAAKQAAELFTDGKVFVIETKNLGDAYSVLSMLDYTADDPEIIASNLTDAMSGVVTGMITRSIRDANLNGVDIKNGEYIGFTDKTMLCSAETLPETFEKLLEKCGAKDYELLTVIFGCNVSESDKESVSNVFNTKYKMLETYTLDGGQEVYDCLVILQ